jgi:hypothetical protein
MGKLSEHAGQNIRRRLYGMDQNPSYGEREESTSYSGLKWKTIEIHGANTGTRDHCYKNHHNSPDKERTTEKAA